MKNEFLAGVLLGVAGSLIPDIVSAKQTLDNAPEMKPFLYASYTMFVLALIVVIMEFSPSVKSYIK